MIYISLISEITFIFLTQIYYKINFITSSSISSYVFLGTLRSTFADCFWRNFFCNTQMCISAYICKICFKELGILLKCRETFEKCIAACNSSKNIGLPQAILQEFSSNTSSNNFQVLLKNRHTWGKTLSSKFVSFG